MEANNQLKPVMAMPSRILISSLVIFPLLLKYTDNDRLRHRLFPFFSQKIERGILTVEELDSCQCMEAIIGISRVKDIANMSRLSI